MSLTRLQETTAETLAGHDVVVLALGYTVYVVESFDTETLPARYGEVDAKLYVQEGAARPLLVGLGGAEGGNAWASQRWKAQRDRFEQAPGACVALRSSTLRFAQLRRRIGFPARKARTTSTAEV